jgi:GDPmannose 4,6-dehydratase
MLTALITGVTGQVGSYLAERLIRENYKVIGLRRRTSLPNISNISSLLNQENFVLVEGDVLDASCIYNLVKLYEPHMIFGLAAQSHVQTSFSQPSYTHDVICGGTLNILSAIHDINPSIRFFNSSSSEMFGNSIDYDGYQRETTPMCPASPYGVAKLAAHHLTKVYRESYGLFASNGILFNMESPRRGSEFVTRKITKWLADIITNESFYKIKLGNLNAKRDWNYVEDSIDAILRIIRADHPDDYVVASGQTYSVETFLRTCLVEAGLCRYTHNIDLNKYIEINELYYRPNEVYLLRGDSSKLRNVLGWYPKVSFNELVHKMLSAELGESNCFQQHVLI